MIVSLARIDDKNLKKISKIFPEDSKYYFVQSKVGRARDAKEVRDIFKLNNIETGTVMSRAFKPMPIILNLVSQNFKKYKNVILFMGDKGRKIFNDTLQEWELDYEEKKSLTNNDSFILNIKNIKKKN